VAHGGVLKNIMMAFNAYDGMMLLAGCVALTGTIGFAIRFGLPWPKVLLCLIPVALAAVFGARLWYRIGHWMYFGRWAGSDFQWLWDGGGSLYGGLMLGIAVGGVACRILQLDSLRVADAGSLPMFLGIAIVRVGCWQTGCCFGQATDRAWGIIPEINSPAWLYQFANNPLVALVGAKPVYPTQIFEMMAALIAAACAGRAMWLGKPPGVAALTAILSFTFFRWLILPYREYRLGGEFEIKTYQFLYPLLILTFVIALLRLRSGLDAD
jgi:phosphatidylglycerol:prolipoprotein diacylglycerol transferase